jgi:hypothetical protein
MTPSRPPPCLHPAHRMSCRATRHEYTIKVLDKSLLKLRTALAWKNTFVRPGSGRPGIVRLHWVFWDDWSFCELAPSAVTSHVEGATVTLFRWVLLVTDQGQLCRLKLDPAVGAIGFTITQPSWTSPRVEGQLSVPVPLLCLCPLAGGRPIFMTSCRRINTALGTMILRYLSLFSRRSRSP